MTMQDLATLIKTENNQLRAYMASRMQRNEDKQDNPTKRQDEVEQKQMATSTKLDKVLETSGQTARSS